MRLKIIDRLNPVLVTLAALCLVPTLCHAEDSPSETKQSPNAHAMSNESIEAQRKQDNQKGASSIDQEASLVISETQKAITAIQKKDKKEALAALERATGKVNILIARNEKAVLIPVNFGVEVANTAPLDPKAIKAIAEASRDKLKDKHYGEARVLLDTLRSEVRVRTFNLPLATYPAVLLGAAKLLDQDKNAEANSLLITALNTLVIVDKSTSIPLLELTEALKLADDKAQKSDEKEKASASKDLSIASAALKRAEALGHVDDKSAKDFQKRIDELDRKIKGKEATASFFTKLRESVASSFSKQSESESKGNLTSKKDDQAINK